MKMKLVILSSLLFLTVNCNPINEPQFKDVEAGTEVYKSLVEESEKALNFRTILDDAADNFTTRNSEALQYRKIVEVHSIRKKDVPDTSMNEINLTAAPTNCTIDDPTAVDGDYSNCVILEDAPKEVCDVSVVYSIFMIRGSPGIMRSANCVEKKCDKTTTTETPALEEEKGEPAKIPEVSSNDATEATIPEQASTDESKRMVRQTEAAAVTETAATTEATAVPTTAVTTEVTTTEAATEAPTTTQAPVTEAQSDSTTTAKPIEEPTIVQVEPTTTEAPKVQNDEPVPTAPKEEEKTVEEATEATEKATSVTETITVTQTEPDLMPTVAGVLNSRFVRQSVEEAETTTETVTVNPVEPEPEDEVVKPSTQEASVAVTEKETTITLEEVAARPSGDVVVQNPAETPTDKAPTTPDVPVAEANVEEVTAETTTTAAAEEPKPDIVTPVETTEIVSPAAPAKSKESESATNDVAVTGSPSQ